MEVIRLQYPNEFKVNEDEQIAIALGFFDGLHIGHQEVINTMINIADMKGLKKAVLTFDPHPSVVLSQKQQRTTYITPLPVKEKMLEEYGIDYLFVVNFSSDFAQLSPDTFVKEYLIGSNVKEVVAGFDFTYGHMGKGSVATLEQYSEFNTTCIVKKEDSGEKISTTRIRELLTEDKLEAANRLLGRSYGIEGIVVQGEKRGRTIGFPTANIEPSYKYFLPSLGVYAVTMTVGSDPTVYKGVASIGVKPTFHDNHKVTIEVHIIDYDRTIYGETVTVYWEHFIRHELKFDGIDALIKAIQNDKDKAIELLKDK